MPGNLKAHNNKPYLRIVGGNLVQEVDKTTSGARLREGELKDGTKFSKWEISYMNWTGKVESIQFKDSEYGTSCMLDLGDAILSFNTDSKYFQDMACKLLSSDITKEITFHPYDMIGDNDKNIRGVSVQQEGVKLKNYFYDFEKKEILHGYPKVDQVMKEKLKKNYWKVYFAEVAAFLIEKLENLQIPKAQQVANIMGGEVIEEIPTDLPFD